MATPPDPQITLALPLSQVNLLLTKLSKASIEDCIDLFMDIRVQTQRQIEQIERQRQQAENPEPMPPPAKPNGANLEQHP